MKLIIDINEVKYNEIMKYVNTGWNLPYLETIIANGTPIPDNATNGDILKTLIPMDCYGDEAEKFYGYIEWDYSKWWNAPYKAESEDKE